MDLTSLENCTALYKVSGWDDCRWCFRDVSDTDTPHWMTDLHALEHEQCFPAYDLGYLLRKLPNEATSKRQGGYHYLYLHHGKQDWYAYYGEIDTTELMASGDTPEDAAALLAIELIKSGVVRANDKPNSELAKEVI